MEAFASRCYCLIGVSVSCPSGVLLCCSAFCSGADAAFIGLARCSLHSLLGSPSALFAVGVFVSVLITLLLSCFLLL
jgi:hypothetical protein